MARELKTFLIYRAKSPSGKSYVGLTSMSLRKRWTAHVMRAKRAGKGNTHPLNAAILRYGQDFELSVLEAGLTREEAMLAETRWIAELGSQIPNGYNISPGGEADGAAGANRLRELMADPEWREDYLAKLREACVDRKFSAKAHEAAAEWRLENPRIAYAMARRGSRIAAKIAGGVPTDPRFSAWGRLFIPGARVAAARRAYFTRPRVVAAWAQRSTEEVRSIGRKIGVTLSKHHRANPEKIKATLVETRKKIDREKQSVAASRGLRKWWADLYADPARYEEYIERRKATARAKRAS
jgi:hypothetical protein